MKFGLKTIVMFGLSMAMGISASADTINATLNSVTPSQTSVGINLNGHSENAWAGMLQWHKNSGSYTGLTGNFQTFCVEITQNVILGSSYTFNVVSPTLVPNPSLPNGMGVARAARLSELFGEYYLLADDSNNNAAAFQVAVWEIVNDDTLSLGDGAFRLQNPGSTIGGIANTWLASLDGTGKKATLGGMTDPCLQDQVFFISMDPPTPGPVPSVPVPAAAWTGGALLLGMFGARARKMINA